MKIVNVRDIEYHIYETAQVITSPQSGWQGARCWHIHQYRAWMELFDQNDMIHLEVPLIRHTDHIIEPANNWIWSGWPWLPLWLNDEWFTLAWENKP